MCLYMYICIDFEVDKSCEALLRQIIDQQDEDFSIDVFIYSNKEIVAKSQINLWKMIQQKINIFREEFPIICEDFDENVGNIVVGVRGWTALPI